MMNHFGTRFLNEDGSWKNLMNQRNSTSDMCMLMFIGTQFPRLVGTNSTYPNFSSL